MLPRETEVQALRLEARQLCREIDRLRGQVREQVERADFIEEKNALQERELDRLRGVESRLRSALEEVAYYCDDPEDCVVHEHLIARRALKDSRQDSDHHGASYGTSVKGRTEAEGAATTGNRTDVPSASHSVQVPSHERGCDHEHGVCDASCYREKREQSQQEGTESAGRKPEGRAAPSGPSYWRCLPSAGWHYFEKGLPACRCGELSSQQETESQSPGRPCTEPQGAPEVSPSATPSVGIPGGGGAGRHESGPSVQPEPAFCLACQDRGHYPQCTQCGRLRPLPADPEPCKHGTEPWKMCLACGEEYRLKEARLSCAACGYAIPSPGRIFLLDGRGYHPRCVPKATSA